MAFRSTSYVYDEWSVAVPTGTQNNDIIVLCVRAKNTNNAITFDWPTGFTQWYLRNTGDYYFAVAWKRASSESGTYTVTPNPEYVDGLYYTRQPTIICSAFRGRILSGDPLDVGSDTAYVTNDDTIRAASITTSEDKTDLVWLGHADTYPYLLTVPSGFTELGNGSNWPSVDDPMNSFYMNRSTPAGATGNVDSTCWGYTSVKHAFLLALLEDPTTNVSDSVAIVFNTKSTVSNAVALEWNTCTAVSPQTKQFIFNTLTLASTSLDIVWDTLSDSTAVGTAIEFIWDTASDITTIDPVATQTLIWHTKATVTDAVALAWNTHVELELSQLNSRRVFNSVGSPTTYNSIGSQCHYNSVKGG